MRAHPALDYESFQKLLDNAFVVQQSGIDAQLLFDIVKLQQAMATEKPDIDDIMRAISDHALKVADAASVAITLLESDQLTYRAGSGSTATYIAPHVTPELDPSAPPHGEILRIEDARNDTRIEAAICRQFGATSLLILPVLVKGTPGGLIEILFSEPHTFHVQEVRTYRLLAGMVGDALLHDLPHSDDKDMMTHPVTVPQALKQITFERQEFSGSPESAYWLIRKPLPGHLCRALLEGLCSVLRQSTNTAASTTLQALNRLSIRDLHWNTPVIAAALALVVAGWNAYDHRASLSSPTPQESSYVLGPEPLSSLGRTPMSQAELVGEPADSKATVSAFIPDYRLTIPGLKKEDH